MLGIILKILSIVGIVLLAVLGLLLLSLFLLLFFPFTYRVRGSKDDQGLCLTAGVSWLFGLFRVRFRYPEPGCLTVKVLWFTLFHVKIPPEKGPEAKQKNTKKESGKGIKPDGRGENLSAEAENSADSFDAEQRPESPDPVEAVSDDTREKTKSPDEKAFPGKISEIIQKIKYTIHHIYDKIKEIWENISYYMDLLQEDNTKQLLSHALCRGGKILRSIRPKHMKVQLLLGMDSPDTTGYIYGIYCILSAAPGPAFQVVPDFEKKRLEGTFDIAGHVIVWVFVINGLRLLCDKKLRLFLKKLKAGRKKIQKAAA